MTSSGKNWKSLLNLQKYQVHIGEVILKMKCSKNLWYVLASSKKDLDNYLNMLEEAEKRDHRKLGKEMDLFHFREESPGSVFWHQKGWKFFKD